MKFLLGHSIQSVPLLSLSHEMLGRVTIFAKFWNVLYFKNNEYAVQISWMMRLMPGLTKCSNRAQSWVSNILGYCSIFHLKKGFC